MRRSTCDHPFLAVSLLAPVLVSGLVSGLASALACVEVEVEAPDVPPDLAYCDPVRDWDPALAALEEEVLVLLNERRAEGARCGNVDVEAAPPLTMDPALRCAARVHALDMGAQDYFANVDPDDLGFVERSELAGYEGTPIQQIIGARQSSAEQTVDAIMGNTSLCARAMSPEADQVGIGHGPDTVATYVRYWAQVFGAGES